MGTQLGPVSKIKEVATFPKVTSAIRFIVDECFPPVLRDQRWFFAPIAFLYNRKLDIDFKRRAPFMTSQEFRQAYEDILPMRATDMTRKTRSLVMASLAGSSILEVGCGNGDISLRCAEKGYKVLATDLAEGNLEAVRRKAEGRNFDLGTQVADVQALPLAEGSFDTTLCLHTLEHVLNLPRAISELKRVTRLRLIVVVPRERYYRYTCNYHLHFFGGPEQLILAMGIQKASCRSVDGALFYVAELGEEFSGSGCLTELHEGTGGVRG